MTGPRRSVITGGPGAGKSTLLGALAERGIATCPEVARVILKAPCGMEMRASRPGDFALAILEAELEVWSEAKSAVVLYDRGFPDIVGFLALTFAVLLGTQRLGWSLAFSIISVLIVSLSIVPAIMSLTYTNQKKKKGTRT